MYHNIVKAQETSPLNQNPYLEGVKMNKELNEHSKVHNHTTGEKDSNVPYKNTKGYLIPVKVPSQQVSQ